ncbi:gliding motility-associated ABC transporter ATP-binding subunit GldA [Cytophagales bacterium LB-30]|uniref:Gliding motility-associated ABC transporter ATP-binding subunit GldA n=1 Tax=Shiella aurantiaca TaxID=3058365 RepID=A0ABT8F4L7_9BACT|nr:gliding motility-associated ABC transporter ATP-binding subunit GldA [Shiella aurantiaca]MDN4164931.1 gliding motility-associated ABC transporter ATP-binding subunit GldA [Shiella aurantiaca]
MAIEIHHLVKTYGTQRAVDDISFSLNEGEIVGFLGPNGAGKSTTMKILACYLPPSEGEVKVGGFDVREQHQQARKLIGYLPEHNPLYLDMYVHEFLRFAGSLYGIKGQALKSRVEEMVEKCGLTVEQHKKIGILSKGYRQRVGLAQALLHNPKVLILDEPTTGLDPNQILEIRQLIREVSANKTVLFSTHIMQEVEALCNRAIIINKGRIVADNSLSQIKNRQGLKTLHVEFDKEVQVEDFAALEGVQQVKVAGAKVSLQIASDKEVRPALSQLALQKGWVILSLQQQEDSMEKVFQELTGGTHS